MRRIRVYISGPITKGSRTHNFNQAVEAEEWLMKNGYAPLNPMRSMLLPFAWQEDMPHDLWIDCDLAWVEAADVVLRLPGESEGADKECDHARKHGIEVVTRLAAAPTKQSRFARRRFQESAEMGPLPELKETNPKDAVGSTKVSFSKIPVPVLAELALALTEGAIKYGRHNYRAAGVRASVYYDALLRHIGAWWEGEDLDAASGLSHVTKAIAGLTVLRDSMIRGNWNDDRPPKTLGFIEKANEQSTGLHAKLGEPVEEFYAGRFDYSLEN